MEEEEEKEEEEDMDVVTDLISRWNIISPYPRNSSSTDWPPSECVQRRVEICLSAPPPSVLLLDRQTGSGRS